MPDFMQPASSVLATKPLKTQLGLTPPVAPKPPAQDEPYRDIADPVATRKAIYDMTFEAVSNMAPVSNKQHTLRLTNPEWIDPDYYDLKTQKKAIIGNQALGRRIRGTWELLDNATGQVIDAKKMTVARVPFMTDRGTFIHNGVEYTISNQLRLRPGVFARQKENGEIEAHANIIPGHGVGHRYFLDPEKQAFYIRLAQSKTPLMPLLRALGASDKELIDHWGGDIFQANAKLDDGANVNKLYEKLVGSRGTPGEDKRTALANVMQKMEVDPEVMHKTLGQPFNTLNKDALLTITKRLLGISRGEQDIDDRDNLAFQTIHGPEDLFSERLEKDYGGARRNLLFRSTFKKNLSALTPGALTRQIESVILNSGLAQPIEEVNPSEILDRITRITKMGEGGLSSMDSVPDESRMVQMSHAFFVDPVRTPESERVGIDLYLASSIQKGKNGQVFAPFIDAKTGEKVYRSSQKIANSTVTTPDQMREPNKRVLAIRDGVLDYFPKSEIDLVVPDYKEAFSALAHYVPLSSMVKAQRMSMGSRMSTQALGLVKGEAPFVQTAVTGQPGKSYEDLYGERLGALRAKSGGTVMAVDADSMKVKYDDGTTADLPLYNNFVLNRKSGLHNTPMVQPGDKFQPGQLLAKSNFTDDNGTSALGLNARVAYLADKGYNFEDAIRISESMAKRMTSEHMYQHSIEYDDKTKSSKRDFVSLFPGAFEKALLKNIDNDGVIKVGSQVNYGEPLILGAKIKETTYGRIHRKGKPMYSNVSETWEHNNPGVVTDVFKGPGGVNVVVKSTSQMQPGDKLAFRYGDKSVVSDIVPDHKMPILADGKPAEIVCNPLSVISRGNPAQIIETVLGKISERTGKPYKLDDFGADDLESVLDFARKELDKHGLTDKEDVTDPETGRVIPGILTGNRFVMKLSHMAEDKLQGRAFGSYTQDGVPAKGGPEGSKQIGLLLTNALLSHGANSALYDASVVRGQKNEDQWLAFMNGLTPPKPHVPQVYQKFINQLRGSGIHVVEDGTQTHIMAMTNRDVKEMTGNRYLKHGETLDFAKGMRPLTGGLFDPTLTGGLDGNRWSAVKLHEPLPNPVMEEPIRRLLKLTRKDFEEVLAGRKTLNNGETGPGGIQKALSSINVDKSIEEARADVVSGKRGKRDEAVRRLKYLKSAQKLGLHPKDWMLDAVPVLPPKFRPVSMMPNGLPLVSDPNYLYKELIEANDNWRQASDQVDDVGEERLAAYNAFRAVTGLGDPVHPKLQEKKVQGLLAHIFGSSPKSGMMQRRLIGSAVDLVGRAVITPNPELDMDSVGLPEDRAWDIYKPFIARRLRRKGMRLADALRSIEDRTDVARKELLSELDDHPLVIDRAPAWHKFSVMAFWPRLVKSDTLQISPLVVKGFGADFDGDAMQYHVLADADAIKEAKEKLLPSANLLSAADFKTPMHQPGQEYVGGLYAASTRKSNRRRRTIADLKTAIELAQRGELGIDDEIEIMKK